MRESENGRKTKRNGWIGERLGIAIAGSLGIRNVILGARCSDIIALVCLEAAP